MPAPVCRIDDFGPLPLVRPASAADLGEVVRSAAAEGKALYPVSGGTMFGLGLPPTRPGVAADLRGLDQVIDYPARDMTITVQAGITLGRLQALLGAQNQRLPVDVPRADVATLGGSLAVNASGSRRYGFGTWRDYVIGIRFVNDKGEEVKAGGRVVKNVAGYDLCKLHVGALGTLGAITEVTLKLRPVPEVQAVMVLNCDHERVAELLELLHASRARPVCLDLLNADAVRYIDRQAGLGLPESRWVLVIGLEDNRDAVCWQVQQVIRELPAEVRCGVDTRAGAAAEPVWRALTELGAPAGSWSFKANMVPAAMASFCGRAGALLEGVMIQAHAGNGVVVGQVPGDWTPGRVRAALETLGAWTRDGRGHVVVTACPAAWKSELPVWGAPRGDAWLMREVKKALDPHGVFNPGRFVDGI
jgi:glycolate oxidase FAD binding subunit